MQIDVINKEHEKVDTVELPEAVFAVDVREALLWEQVKAQRASKRRGTHDTKTRAQVAGGGAKPFKQKGTGRARQGSTRAPNLVGGGTVFGPHPRDYAYRLPRTARRAALCSALSSRVKAETLTVLDQFSLDAPRTKDVIAFTQGLQSSSVLIVDIENNELSLSTRNIKKTKYLKAEAINVYDILDYERLVLTKAALTAVVDKAMAGPERNQLAPSNPVVAE